MAKFVVVFLSILITTIVSFIAASPALFWGLSANNYFSYVAIVFAIQIFIGGCWKYYVNNKFNLEEKKLKIANELAESVQNIQISCAYCGSTNNTKLLIGNDNRFTCDSCNNVNSILLSCTSARTTNPTMPKATLAEIFKNIDTQS